MTTRARFQPLGVALALGLALVLSASGTARAAGDLALDPVASLDAREAPGMCPARKAREAESQIFALQRQLALPQPPQPADAEFQVLNVRGSNYATGQRMADPAVLHLEGQLSR